MINRFLDWLADAFYPTPDDSAARHIKNQIAEARAKHRPVRHLQQALTDLRAAQLRATR